MLRAHARKRTRTQFTHAKETPLDAIEDPRTVNYSLMLVAEALTYRLGGEVTISAEEIAQAAGRLSVWGPSGDDYVIMIGPEQR